MKNRTEIILLAISALVLFVVLLLIRKVIGFEPTIILAISLSLSYSILISCRKNNK